LELQQHPVLKSEPISGGTPPAPPEQLQSLARRSIARRQAHGRDNITDSHGGASRRRSPITKNLATGDVHQK
jgi:hypothetical protein